MSDEPFTPTRAMLKILKHLQTAVPPDTSGAAISKATGVGAGTLYPALNQLEQVGWVTSEWEELPPDEPVRPRRRYYSLTPTGRREAHKALADHEPQGLPDGNLGWAATAA